MQKRMIDRFTEDFERHLKDSRTHEECFNKALKDFEEKCGFTPYSSHRSYKSARSTDRRKFR